MAELVAPSQRGEHGCPQPQEWGAQGCSTQTRRVSLDIFQCQEIAMGNYSARITVLVMHVLREEPCHNKPLIPSPAEVLQLLCTFLITAGPPVQLRKEPNPHPFENLAVGPCPLFGKEISSTLLGSSTWSEN